MTKFTPFHTSARGVDNHPAAAAWAELAGRTANRRPSRITVLKPEKRKSAVYRLAGAGPGSSDVIAKRARREALRVEHDLYTTILPALPVCTVQFYGYVPAGDDAGWLFLEDAGDDLYQPKRADHRALASRWLSALHTSATPAITDCPLPRKDAGYYLGVRREAQVAIAENLGNPMLTADHLVTMRNVLGHFEVLESRWDDVSELAEVLPHTLVHADFVRKNVRVRTSGVNGRTLVPFDWESAGWGPLGVDLLSADIPAYASGVRERWSQVRQGDVETVARVGQLFRLIACVEWTTWAFGGAWLDRPMAHMSSYDRGLAALIAQLGWTSPVA